MNVSQSPIPKISVLMPVYNTQENYLREAIESILSQTYRDFEFIILNDASTDAHVEHVVKSYDDPRIIYSVNETNLGISGTRNRLVEMARGEYLAVMDHDDISLPQRFEKEVACLESNPDIGVVSCFVEVWDDRRKTVWEIPEKSIDIKKTLLVHDCIPHPCAMIRKSVLVENNIWYESIYTPSEDYALFVRLINKTEFYNIQEVLCHYRNHSNNTTHLKSLEMGNASIVIRKLARRQNPDLWSLVRLTVMKKHRFKLFDFFPLLKIEESSDKKIFYLLGFIPVFSIQKGRWRKK